MKIFTKFAAVAIAALFAVNANGATVDYNGITWTIGTGANAGKLTAKSVKDASLLVGDYALESPVTINGTEYTIVSIGTVLKGNTAITSLTLPDDCITVGRAGLSKMDALKTVRLSPNMVTIPGNIFQDDIALEEIEIPGSAKALKSSEFQNCPALKKLVIAEGPTELEFSKSAWGTDNKALALEEIIINRAVGANYTNATRPLISCTTLKKATFGGSCTAIPASFFAGCSALEEADIACITNLGTNAFEGTALKTIEIPAGISTISASAFASCAQLNSVTLNEGTSTIDAMAFKNSGLKSIALPASVSAIRAQAFQGSQLAGALDLASVKSIGDDAFAGTKLTSVSIPATTNSIGSGVFRDGTTLASFAVDAANENFKVNALGALVSFDGKRIVAFPPAAATAAYEDADATSIDAYAFQNAANLTSIKVDNVVEFGDYALAGTSIKNMTLRGVVGRYVLRGCTSLESAVLDNALTEVPFGVFYGCSSLAAVSLPSAATVVKQDAFNGCTALKEITLPSCVSILEAGCFTNSGIKTIIAQGNTPAVMAQGVFVAGMDITVKVNPANVDKYKAARGWSYLNIVGDESVPALGSTPGMPSGIYFAGDDGVLYKMDPDTKAVEPAGIDGIAHTLQLLSCNNRIYGASAGVKTIYSNTGSTDGDGKLLYVNQIDGHPYIGVLYDNAGGNAYEDPFGITISGDSIFVNDRNVAIRKYSVEDIAVDIKTWPAWLENAKIGYYGNNGAGGSWSYGCIKAGFAIESAPADDEGKDPADQLGPTYWLGIKYNGNGLFRFNEKHVGQATVLPYPEILTGGGYVMSTFYFDEKNDDFYIFIGSSTSPDFPGGGLYKVKISDLKTETPPAKITDIPYTLIDNSPVYWGNNTDAELIGITQFATDGEYLYWGYIPPTGTQKSTNGEVDPSNPLHKQSIKRVKLNTDNPQVEIFAETNVGVYGLTFHEYVPEPEGVDAIAGENNAQIVNSVYYNLQGVRVVNPAQGQIVIRVNTLSNGKVKAYKTIVK